MSGVSVGAPASSTGSAAMTDPGSDSRPEPRWGQYSDVAPVAPTFPPPVAVTAPEGRPAPTSDVLVTVVLLAIGLFDVIRQFAAFANFAPVMRESYLQLGYGEFTSDALANGMGIGQNVARVVLILIAVAWSARRIAQRKRAFWVPLAAGGLATVLLLAGILVVMLLDPAITDYLNTLTE